jgi:hypothetical protein
MHTALALDQNSTESETSDGGEAASNHGNDNSNNVPSLENQNNTDLVDGKENKPRIG